MKQYVATVNVPGYLSMDDDPPRFDTPQEAWQYLLEDAAASWDDAGIDNAGLLEAHAAFENNHSETGAVYTSTPGYDGNHDLGLAYCVTEIDPKE